MKAIILTSKNKNTTSTTQLLTVAEIESKIDAGKAIIKRGRKIMFRVYNRAVFFGCTPTNPKETWSIELPQHGVSIQGEDLADIMGAVNDYVYGCK